MALDKVIQDILDSARMEAKRLSDEAEREKAAILRGAEEEVAKKKRLRDRDLQEALRRMERQEISSAELEAKRLVLNARKEALDALFEETLREIETMPASEKASLYRKILDGARGHVSNPKVVCPRGESGLIASYPGIAALTEGDIGSGLLLESGDGAVRLDYRFSTILESVWDREMKSVSSTLFG